MRHEALSLRHPEMRARRQVYAACASVARASLEGRRPKSGPLILRGRAGTSRWPISARYARAPQDDGERFRSWPPQALSRLRHPEVRARRQIYAACAKCCACEPRRATAQVGAAHPSRAARGQAAGRSALVMRGHLRMTGRDFAPGRPQALSGSVTLRCEHAGKSTQPAQSVARASLEGRRPKSGPLILRGRAGTSRWPISARYARAPQDDGERFRSWRHRHFPLRHPRCEHAGNPTQPAQSVRVRASKGDGPSQWAAHPSRPAREQAWRDQRS
jgi:hypothetical protein